MKRAYKYLMCIVAMIICTVVIYYGFFNSGALASVSDSYATNELMNVHGNMVAPRQRQCTHAQVHREQDASSGDDDDNDDTDTDDGRGEVSEVKTKDPGDLVENYSVVVVSKKSLYKKVREY